MGAARSEGGAAERKAAAMVMSHSSYSFPILSQSEILACLNELEMEVEEAQLAKPNYDFVKALYENLVVLLVSFAALPAPEPHPPHSPSPALAPRFPKTERRSLSPSHPPHRAGRRHPGGDATAHLQRDRLPAVPGAARQ